MPTFRVYKPISDALRSNDNKRRSVAQAEKQTRPTRFVRNDTFGAETADFIGPERERTPGPRFSRGDGSAGTLFWREGRRLGSLSIKDNWSRARARAKTIAWKDTRHREGNPLRISSLLIVKLARAGRFSLNPLLSTWTLANRVTRRERRLYLPCDRKVYARLVEFH